jgi:dephospho-CoA kinase
MSNDSGQQGWVAGITGGIACGKTEVGRMLAGTGVEVIEADELARDVMKAGTVVFDRVVETFGSAVVGPDGEVDRELLGERVFSDERERAALNALVHPAIEKSLRAWVAGIRARAAYGAAVVPLLFEVGWEKVCDAVLCVVADEALMMERLCARGLSESQARQRIAAQMPVLEKARRSDQIVENNEDLETLRKRTLEAWRAMLNKERKNNA